MATLVEHLRGNVKILEIDRIEIKMETPLGMLFFVPIADIGDGRIRNEDRAGLYQKWIKRQYDMLIKNGYTP